MNNSKLVYNEFKKIKAFRHSGSAQEVLTYSQVGFDITSLTPTNMKEIDSQIENSYNLYLKSGRSKYLIRSAILASEFYDSCERYQDSANYLIKIANEIKDQSVIVPLFLE